MRAALLSAGLLLTVSLAALAAPGATALTGGCDGVVVSDQFTGHCGNLCTGTIYMGGNRWGDHTCTTAACTAPCPDVTRPAA